MESEVYRLLKEQKTEELVNVLEQNPSLLNFSDGNGVSLLMLSYYFGNADLSQYLLTKMQPANIHESVVAGNKKLVEEFIGNNPDTLETFSSDGFNPLGYAAYFRRTEIVSLLLRNGANANIASRNSFQVTPLHSAVAANHAEICKILLEAGANPNARQQKNITPLHSAAHNGNVQIASLLLEYGADKNAKSDDGKSAMDYANEVKASDVIKIL
jgi:uncharacterized protein